MAEEFKPEEKHEALEADIRRLSEEIQKFRETPEVKGLSDEELLKKAIQNIAPLRGPGGASLEESGEGPLPDYAQGAPANTRLEIESLLDMAFHQGIAKAVREAAGSSPYVLDAFHDALTGKLYEEFKKRGLLK